MTITMFKAKLQRLRVTGTELFYEGSIAIDEELLAAGGVLPFEGVLVVNVNNGARFETYAIPAPAGSRTVMTNGPCARLTEPGDEVVVMSFASMTPEEAMVHRPRVVVVDEDNDPVEVKDLPLPVSSSVLTV